MNSYRMIAALNNSGMDYLKQSPAHFRAWADGVLTTLPSPAQVFGSALHCAILEPDDFHLRYAWFDGDRRTKAGKAEYAALVEAGFITLSDSDWRDIAAMREAVMAHPTARHLIENSIHEFAYAWTDNDTGAACKGIADIVMTTSGGLVLADIKTTIDASEEAFMLSFARYGYHRQAAFYLDGFKAQAFNVIAVEKTTPYGVMVYRVPPHVLAVGRELYKPLAALYQNCVESGHWPNYDTAVHDIHLPAWAIPDELAA